MLVPIGRATVLICPFHDVRSPLLQNMENKLAALSRKKNQLRATVDRNKQAMVPGVKGAFRR